MSPAFLLALALQAQPDPPQLADLRRAWQESCADRAYGTFDDVCTQMSDQIRAYERDARRSARRAAPPAPTAETPPSAGPPAQPPAPPAAAAALPASR